MGGGQEGRRSRDGRAGWGGWKGTREASILSARRLIYGYSRRVAAVHQQIMRLSAAYSRVVTATGEKRRCEGPALRTRGRGSRFRWRSGAQSLRRNGARALASSSYQREETSVVLLLHGMCLVTSWSERRGATCQQGCESVAQGCAARSGKWSKGRRRSVGERKRKKAF